MKKLISTIAILILFAVGCTDQTSVTSPDTNTSTNEVFQLNKKSTVSKVIDGNAGGYITLGDFNSAKNGRGIYACLIFPAGSFSGIKTITITLDDTKLSGTFDPGMQFNMPVSFSALFSGVTGNNNNFTFNYFGPNGVLTEIPSSFLYFDASKHVLGILNAQIPHFSRYVFVR